MTLSFASSTSSPGVVILTFVAEESPSLIAWLMSERLSSLSLRPLRTARSSVRMVSTRCSTSSSVSAASLIVTVTAMSCSMFWEDFTRILDSHRPFLLRHFLKLFVSDPRQSEPARRAS